MYSLSIVNDKIRAEIPFKIKDQVKALSGSTWNQEEKSWYIPISEIRALNIIVPRYATRTTEFEVCLESVNRSLLLDTEIIESVNLPDVPITTMKAWNHQKQGFWFTKDKKAAMLAMDMGTGKTKVTLDVIQNNDINRVLVICPAHVIHVWPSEIKKHIVNQNEWEIVTLNHGKTPDNVIALKFALDVTRIKNKKLFVVVNYESVWRKELAKIITTTFWDLIIADESHRIKSPQGVASKFMGKLKLVSKRRLALTGTPMPHSPMDIFAQYRFLDEKIFGGSYTRFKHRYGKWGGFGGYQLLGIENQVELNQKFYSIAYKVGKEVLDLPEVMPPMIIPIHLDYQSRKQYNSMLNDFLVWLNENDSITAVNSLAKLLRLQQITSGFLPNPEIQGEYVEITTAKRQALSNVLEDLDMLEPVVIFCRFRKDLDTVHEVAKELGRKSCELSGRVNSLALWQQSNTIPILAVQIQAGGVGIDLTRARYCIYYSLGFSLGDYEQSLARVHRPGQTRPVQYVHLITQNTVDETVYQALDEKKQVVEEILRKIRNRPESEEYEFSMDYMTDEMEEKND